MTEGSGEDSGYRNCRRWCKRAGGWRSWGEASRGKYIRTIRRVSGARDEGCSCGLRDATVVVMGGLRNGLGPASRSFLMPPTRKAHRGLHPEAAFIIIIRCSAETPDDHVEARNFFFEKEFKLQTRSPC
jgi:hypothetical protein